MNTLSQELREGTKQSHTLAENTAYMKCFLKGIVERVPFRKLLANLYFIYGTLEDALLTYQADPVLGKIYCPELNRTAKIAADLEFFYGKNWDEKIKPTRSALTYVLRLQELATNDPILLIAHAYTRYLGDLSGGQALKSIVRGALRLPEDLGTAMFTFDSLPTPGDRRQFKTNYRETLDSLPLDAATIERIVAEANHAFALNRAVMHDLEPEVKAAIGEHTFDLLTRQDRPGSTEARCPHAQTVALATAE
ncbi:heme oxygenase (biliverdin-producing) [[Limnothrix rosea] IAM M-220]|uniref:biliverdin-producing heme oxygenase n=1 Tax=[Limnothrix rosea] IAM M-220 TaxID=454133 RepID=UPI000967421B|nr:heme oxygenase (biliverdin-producing) [[Limnothrix rosea] IAM M-220]OKH15139.1 heme oxygenase [[Limnothrix rosea] IAM M-220]